MAKILVQFDPATGIVPRDAEGRLAGDLLPPTVAVIDDPGTLPANTALRITASGAAEIVPDWRGSGPWYDQRASSDARLTPIHVTEVGIDPTANGWAMEPRAETAKEKIAREKAEAAAAAAQDRARIDAIELSPVQFATALMRAGVIAPAEAEEFAASGKFPEALKTGMEAAMTAAGFSETDKAIGRIKLAGALVYRRADPLTPLLGAVLKTDEAGIDALFIAGAQA